MKIILADTNKEVTDAFKKEFKTLNWGADIEIHQGSIFDIPNKFKCDAFVSPANSWGFMCGGLDLALSQYFGWQVQERIQTRIKNEHNGELLVGQALIVPTGHKQVPYCICAPTMRLPTILRPSDGNVFLAMRAILLLLESEPYSWNRSSDRPINTIAVPGLGTGVGQLSPKDCAEQMYWAYYSIMNTTYFPASLYNAREMYGFNKT